ncbi:MAG: MatE transporter, partial [Myxococcota bacterium]|nr:MatE transporter [Myxococcota bacterium]
MNRTRRISLVAAAALLLVCGQAWAQDAAPTEEGTSLVTMLLFAYVGGLILNIMPCVLPVLSIKALGLVQQADQGRRSVLLHGVAYTAGVLVSFGVMAALVIGLQASGKLVGWGFQLQSPLFVAILGALTFGFGLSLFGVFEVGMPGASKLDQVA